MINNNHIPKLLSYIIYKVFDYEKETVYNSFSMCYNINIIHIINKNMIKKKVKRNYFPLAINKTKLSMFKSLCAKKQISMTTQLNNMIDKIIKK